MLLCVDESEGMRPETQSTVMYEFLASRELITDVILFCIKNNKPKVEINSQICCCCRLFHFLFFLLCDFLRE